MNYIKVFLVVFLFNFLFTSFVYSESKDLKVSLGVGGLFLPEYEGAEDYKFKVLPCIDIKYKEKYFLNFKGLGVNFYNKNNIKTDIYLKYNFGRDQDDNSDLYGLGDVDSTVEGHVFLSYTIKLLNIALDFGHALNSGQEGYILKPSLGLFLPFFGEKNIVRLKCFGTYVDNNYMNSYYGVDSVQSIRSGLPLHSTDSDFKDVGIGCNIIHKLDNKWSVSVRLGYKKLINDAGSSPIVKEENQYQGMLFLIYNF
jgi:MipA family protein